MCCGVGTKATLWEQLLSHLPADSGLMAIRPGWQILAELKGEGTSQAPKDRKVGAAASCGCEVKSDSRKWDRDENHNQVQKPLRT